MTMCGFRLRTFWVLTYLLCFSIVHAAEEHDPSSRQLLQSKCRPLTQEWLDSAKVASKPMRNLPLQFPVFSTDPKLGEMADGCVYTIPEEEIRKQAKVPESYIAAVKELADVVAFNADLPDCKSIHTQALEQWSHLVVKWAAAKGFLGKKSTWTGVFKSHQALLATAAGFLKVKSYLDASTRKTVLHYIAAWDQYTASSPEFIPPPGIDMVKYTKALRERGAGRGSGGDVLKGLKGLPSKENLAGAFYNNHEMWKKTARLYASIALGKAGQAKKSVTATVTQLSRQVHDGHIETEFRCTRTVHNHNYYLEAGLLTLSTYKAWGKELPAKLPAVLKQVEKVVESLEAPDAAKRLCAAFKYGPKVVKEQISTTGVPRVRALLEFLKHADQKRPTVDMGKSRFVGYLVSLEL